MAKNFMSSILDELMGRDRNAGPDEAPKKISWDDPEMCSHYLVCFCPNELFVNTKADLGPCPKLHDEQLRSKYADEAPNHRKLQFENEFIRFADKMVQDIEAKIKRGKMRIALANGPDGGTYAGPGSKNAEKIALLTERINVLLKEAEEAGCAGDIEKAQGLLKLCDQLKEEKVQLVSNEVNHPWNPDKAMQVCEVCGSYLIIGEAQHRLDDHIMGKQHMGFAMLRKTMEDVKKNRETRDKDERERIERERMERRQGIVSRDKDKKRDRSRSRSRDRKRRDRDEKRKRSRSKSPSGKLRSKSRDRKDKERRESRDHRKRDTSRDRKSRKHSDEKDKKRSKRSRSRSRDRHRRRRSSRSASRDRRKRDGSRHRRSKEESKEKDSKSRSSKKDEGKSATKSPKQESPRLSPENAPTDGDEMDISTAVEPSSANLPEALSEAVPEFPDDYTGPPSAPGDEEPLPEKGTIEDSSPPSSNHLDAELN